MPFKTSPKARSDTGNRLTFSHLNVKKIRRGEKGKKHLNNSVVYNLNYAIF